MVAVEALEVQHAREIPILNVKKLGREDVEELARLFKCLESKARKLIMQRKKIK